MAEAENNNGGEFGVTAEELKQLSEQEGDKVAEALEERGGLESLVTELRSSARDGLTGEEGDLANRREVFGQNWIPPKDSKSFPRLLWEAFLDPLLIILTVVAAIGLGLWGYTYGSMSQEDRDQDETEFLGWIESVAIIVAVLLVMVVTAVNDWQKERQFQRLQQSVSDTHMFSVVRNGEGREVNVREIVVGDVILVKYGDSIPADGLLLRCSDLQVDESAMTGESKLVRKEVPGAPLVLSGTSVMQGGGKVLVTAVGSNSQAGVIQTLLAGEGEDEEERSVLHGKLVRLAKQIAAVAAGVALVTLGVLVIRQVMVEKTEEEAKAEQQAKAYVAHVMTAITVLVVAIPEGLPLAVTLALAYSVKKMMADHNLVRHLHACETMGNATTICTDKTGTLTTNRMAVVRTFLCGEERGQGTSQTSLVTSLPALARELLGQAVAYNSSYSSRVEERDGLATQLGNKTECALLGLLTDLDIDWAELRKEVPEDDLLKVFPFNSAKKRMSTVITVSGGRRLLVKGAAEVVLEACSSLVVSEGEVEDLGQAEKDRLQEEVVRPMAEQSLRAICLAYRDLDPSLSTETEDDDELASCLTCLAVVGIEDPVRPEVPAAIQQCQAAGITVRMVTGDNLTTARAIAVKCGIIRPGDGFLTIEGEEFNRRVRGPDGEVQQELLDSVWPDLRVLARSKPRDKFTLVRGIIHSELAASREVVAVTGDGTNDAPALKEADVGFAMGIAGTDVAKDASDIILTDDNFSSIVAALMWGRNVYDSIAKFLQFQLTVNVVALVVVVVGACALSLSPLGTIQMLWVNLIMDTLAALALATELPTPELLERAPYGRTASLISPAMARNILGQAVYQLALLITFLFLGHLLPSFCLSWEDPDMCIIEDWRDIGVQSEPTQLCTVIFNSFIFMTLFNEINCRKVHGERNVLKNLFSSPVFLAIWVTTLLLQVAIVQLPVLGQKIFKTAPLSLQQWLLCLVAGLGSLLWYQLIVTVPVPQSWSRQPAKDTSETRDDQELKSRLPSGSSMSRGLPDRVESLGGAVMLRSSRRRDNDARSINSVNQDMFSSLERVRTKSNCQMAAAAVGRNQGLQEGRYV